MKNKLYLLTLFTTALALTSCIQEKGNEFYAKDAGLIGNSGNGSGDGLLPPPVDEPEQGPEEEEKPGDDGDPSTGGGSDDGDPSTGGGSGKQCPAKIDRAKISSGEIRLDDVDCDNNKVAVCHKTSCNTEKYVLRFVDKNAINAHLDHQDRRDFLIDCSQVQVINTVLNPHELNDACNCK